MKQHEKGYEVHSYPFFITNDKMLKAFRYILLSLVICHFLIIALHHLPNNPLKHQFKRELFNYISPFFTQEWKLFAPNPVNSNLSLFYKFSFYKGGKRSNQSKWLDVSEPIIKQRRNNFWSPGQRILKQFSTCYLDVFETNVRALNLIAKSDSLKSDTLKSKKFIYQAIENSLGHRGIVDFSRFVIKEYSKNNQIDNVDSIVMNYKILDTRFPRFSKRESDFFDLKNYEFREIQSLSLRLNFKTNLN